MRKLTKFEKSFQTSPLLRRKKIDKKHLAWKYFGDLHSAIEFSHRKDGQTLLVPLAETTKTHKWVVLFDYVKSNL